MSNENNELCCFYLLRNKASTQLELLEKNNYIQSSFYMIINKTSSNLFAKFNILIQILKDLIEFI